VNSNKVTANLLASHLKLGITIQNFFERYGKKTHLQNLDKGNCMAGSCSYCVFF